MPMDMMDRGGGGGRMMPADRPPPEASDEGSEATSIFLSKRELGDKTCKVGDTLTLKVTNIDPETGDVEAELSAGGGSENSDNNQPGYMNDFDRDVPEEEEE